MLPKAATFLIIENILNLIDFERNYFLKTMLEASPHRKAHILTIKNVMSITKRELCFKKEPRGQAFHFAF